MKQSWKIVVAFLVVFLAGGAIGSVFSLRYAKTQVQALQQFQPAPLGPQEPPGQPGPQFQPGRRGQRGQQPGAQPENFGVQIMNRWMRSNQLDLTPEQRQQIRPIVNDTQESLRRLHRDDLHNGEIIIEKMQDQVAAVLTPAQRAKFDNMINQQRRRMQQYIQLQQRRAAMQQEQFQPGGPMQPAPAQVPPQQMRQGQSQPGQVPPGPGPSQP